MIIRKSKRELETMARAGRVVAEVLELMADTVRPGLTTADLDRKVRHVEILRAAGTIHGLAGLKRPEPRLTEEPDAEAR